MPMDMKQYYTESEQEHRRVRTWDGANGCSAYLVFSLSFLSVALHDLAGWEPVGDFCITR